MISFSSSYFRSEGELRSYFDTKKEETLAELKRQIVSGEIRSEAQWRVYQVAWLAIASPFLFILANLATIFSLLFACIGAKSLSTRCFVYGERTMRNLALIGQVSNLGEKLLVPTFNGRNHPAYEEPPVPLAECPTSIQAIVRKGKSEISLENRAFCQAMCLWFHYLFETGKRDIADEKLLAIAIAHLFTSGSDEVATVLQSGNFAQEDWFGVHLEGHAYKALPFLQNRENFIKWVEGVPPGSYEICLNPAHPPAHTLNFIKTKENSLLFFDPNLGLVDYTEEGPGAIFQVIRRFFSFSSPDSATISIFSAKIQKKEGKSS